MQFRKNFKFVNWIKIKPTKYSGKPSQQLTI